MEVDSNVFQELKEVLHSYFSKIEGGGGILTPNTQYVLCPLALFTTVQVQFLPCSYTVPTTSKVCSACQTMDQGKQG